MISACSVVIYGDGKPPGARHGGAPHPHGRGREDFEHQIRCRRRFLAVETFRVLTGNPTATVHQPQEAGLVAGVSGPARFCIFAGIAGSITTPAVYGETAPAPRLLVAYLTTVVSVVCPSLVVAFAYAAAVVATVVFVNRACARLQPSRIRRLFPVNPNIRRLARTAPCRFGAPVAAGMLACSCTRALAKTRSRRVAHHVLALRSRLKLITVISGEWVFRLADTNDVLGADRCCCLNPSDRGSRKENVCVIR